MGDIIVKNLGMGIKIISPTVFHDDRGYFFENYNLDKVSKIIDSNFVQDNVSVSHKGVLRGLHYQYDNPQSKLVSVLQGSALDVILDIRKDSSTYGHHISVQLSSATNQTLWIPAGFAHGFLSLENNTILQYKCDAYWNKDGEGVIDPFNSDLNIEWGINCDESIRSPRDNNALTWKEYSSNPRF